MLNSDERNYAKYKSKGNANYKKYKETGSERARKKANYNYAAAEALEIKLKNPAKKVEIKKTNIENSFNAKKETTYGVSKPKLCFFRNNKSKNK